MTTPTGVFVRLPLSDTEKMALTSGVKWGGDIEAGILAIGTPVTGVGLPTEAVRVRVHSTDIELAWVYQKAPPSDQDASEYELEVERLLTHEQALAALASLQAEVGRLRAALEEQKTFHESEDKALSKQPTSGQGLWRRNQNQEQIRLIDAALKGPEA
ncbi:hypothetical protein [Acetobacter indonesiensis]|uniref:Uncharacterized protein n=1 Tax=Acetobacter indonesiensis TaxID=104101 RepID=A0A252ANL1_9PROT|nr:hypothetical protein [Acetobacter indonesiensis]OUI91370.1 hypothetical protein HK17_11745 [Acetobacter indonesiensis]